MPALTLETLILGLVVAAIAPAATVLGHQLQPRDTVSNDPYPFCNPATNPNCIVSGKYLVPSLDFSLQNDAGDLAYQKYLPTNTWSFSKWTNGMMPERCYYWGVTADHWKAADFIIYNVTFTDCPGSPFVVCRHKTAPKSIGQISTEIGRIPAKMRQATSMFLVYGDLNSDNPQYGGYIATLAGDGVIVGRSGAYFTTSLVHEMGHAVDSTLVSPGSGKAFSSTATWSKAVTADGYAVSAYGAGSLVEDFAETGRAVLLDAIFPGGLAAWSNHNPNLTQITQQLKAFKAVAGGFYATGGTCDLTRKFPFPTSLVKRV
ncbi:hypothetical protein B0T19DRAFT_181933 [Cercophora scortea]|uniref:Conidiation-specific protein 13 n=1 Tax=Cercophora scortea TaxID=314031 RepID=A0AAE0INL1_9PEZI|nr:hypothetical protein B0T19DRAFT_181933 [Cercophora scortea]